MAAVLDRTAAAIEAAHVPLSGADRDYDRLFDRIGDARIVLLGEASHGTHEFYAERARITRRLITERGFQAVAIEADWPDAWRAGRYARLLGSDADARAALGGFQRFPLWMWRNGVMVEFLEWLRTHNATRSLPSRVGVYGLDLYSMFDSIHAVLDTVGQVAPDALELARTRYACFDHVDEEAHQYGFAAARGLLESCEQDATDQLVMLRARALEAAATPGHDRLAEALFDAAQNAELVRNAEEYYRTMYRGGVSSWNLRDRHMADTLDHVAARLTAIHGDARIVVWEHNSHLGDARATDRAQRGELNVGQLVRERWGSDACSVGFTTFTGDVTAAHDWDGPPHRMHVRDALPGSYERRLHELDLGDFVLVLEDEDVQAALAGPLLERAIGVIYRPETERMSHYFMASLPRQFDAIVHIDATSALAPIDPQPSWHGEEPPETFPSGL